MTDFTPDPFAADPRRVEDRFALRPESFTFDLSLGGRGAGEAAWQVAPDKHAWIVRVQTDFSGILPDLRRLQTSRLNPRLLTSLGYSEGDGRRTTFETVIDRKAGLLTLRQGRDEASAPLLTDLHDPLSVLVWLRAHPDLERGEVLMAGGRVHLRQLAPTEVNGVGAQVFELRPGGALVYIEQAGPRRLLQLAQPTDFGFVDATLRSEEPRRSRPDSPRRRRR